ncbi:phage scaffolding protein [Paenibacillus flagellatus]|uniref:Phage minor structural protein GP20 n=1 Tax=Paenibacillus flagellatus TaxID=2211139 RepID=A0A2V5KNW9_9BACL|nr:phage scaffolding protein [Paenibacillus flagellatus]PYI57030.1 hypothetical protein DLM86_00855 [Paenibacillus flagellatus]
MEWLKQLLKAQGLTDEQITAIVGGVEANYKGWVPEHRFKEVNEAKKTAEDALKDRDKQLEELKKTAGDNAALKEQIEKLQGENKAAKEKYESEAKELRLNTALKLALAGKAHDPDIVAGLLDKSKIELDENGNVKAGFDEQLKALQTSKGFLFVEQKPPSYKGFVPADGKTDKGDGSGSLGASFAKSANESGKAPAAANNPWA